MTKNILSLAALLIVSATFVACTNDDNIIDEPQQPAATGTYTMTVNAQKGGDDATTRALALDGKTLNASWAVGEEVTVYNNTKKAQLDGTLKAQSDGSSTTLKGSLTGTIENGDELILHFNSANYASQSGTLDYIAANCDFAEASITVSSVDGENNVIPTSAASFVNQQAIVKFILKDKEGNDLNVSNLTISAGSNRLVSAGGYRGSGEKTYYTGYTVDAGTGNTNTNGGYDQILDGNTATKWCVSTGTKSEGVWFVEFHTASAVQVDGYKLTTADDTQTYSGRNPKNWTLKAKVNSGDAWTVIDTKTGNTDMPAANCSSVDFETDVQGMYQYFRLEVSTVQSGDWFQLSEMQLYGCSDREFSFRYGNVNVTPASATNELTVALNNQSGASDTYTLTSVDGSYEYTFTKSGVRFESGKYYAITVKMTRQPALGDLYYSDGTYSSTLVAGKTPIGVIAYLGTDAFTETGTNVGGSTFTGHGLVLCLKDAASGADAQWSTETSTYEFGGDAKVTNADGLKRSTNVSGYTNTKTLAEKTDAATKYKAAYAAKNYTGLMAPAGTTGWFLPSAQQWVKMQTGLGGLAVSAIVWGSWFNNDHSAATAWETAMAKAGTKDTVYDSMTDAYLFYWSSSEYSAYNAVKVSVDATGTGGEYGFYWYDRNKDDTSDRHRVRPVLAF